MHVHIMIKYDSFFPACDFCTVQHFLLTFMKLNMSVLHSPFEVILPLPNFSLNYEGQPTEFIDQVLLKFHKQEINEVVIMFFSPVSHMFAVETTLHNIDFHSQA